VEGLEARHLLSYTITDLGTLGGTLSQANAVNSLGQVAGMSTLGSGDQRAMLYQNGSLQNLGTLGGTSSAALGVNDLGQIVGQAAIAGDGASHAFLYANGTMSDLGTLGGGNSQGSAINGPGEIVGWSNTTGNLTTHAFAYNNGVMTDLGTLGGANSQADAINGNGLITGAAFDSSGNFKAFLYSGGSMTNLGTLGGTYSEGFGINLAGQIVGQSTTSGDAATLAFLYSGGTMTGLGTLGGTNSQAFAINDSGTIVGKADVNSFTTDAFVYSGGHMTDLNSLLPGGSGWTLWCATGINNAGQIVGYGINSQGFEHAFLLTPSTGTVSSLGVAGYPSPATAGAAHSYTVSALDSSGHVVTSYTGTVHFTSSDPQAVLPVDYTFTSADQGVHTFTAALQTAGTQSITATDTSNSSITGSQSGITINPAAATTLIVGGFPTPTTAGVSQSFTVTARDAYGNTATGYRGTVHFTSSDAQAALPGNYTFTRTDSGSHSFSATLKTAGSQSLTATDTAHGSITGSQSGITVNAAEASNLVVGSFPSPTIAGAAGSFTVTARDAYGNTASGYRGTVHFTSTDAQAVLPGNYTFTSADAGTHAFNATLKTAGSRSLTATDTTTGSISGSQPSITVRPAAASSLSVAGSSSVTAGTSFSITVTAIDLYGNTATGYRGTVHFTSSDSQANLPANYAFTSTDAGVHRFSAVLNSSGNQSITATDTATGTISGSVTIAVSAANGETLQFSAAAYTARETDGWVVITVTRGGGTTGTVSVQWATSNGTATAGSEYGAASGALTFAAGESSKTFTISILPNGIVEGNETINLALSSASGGATLGTTRTAVLTIEDADGTQNQRFVAQVYLDLLHRQVDPSGLAAWNAVLSQGGTRSQVIYGIESSLEYRGIVVRGLYEHYLHRVADPAGLSAFVNFLGQGGTIEQASSLITGSLEYFANRGGGGNDGFLDALYQDALHRSVDSFGRALFDRALAQGATRQQVAAAIFASGEYEQDLVASYYWLYLHRAADSAGLTLFVNAMKQGARDQDVIAGLLSSGEYYSLVQLPR
jgi:probable HAF family extracellular repeat protein